MIKLLILSAGTNAAYHLSRIIQDKYSHHFSIIGVDVNERHLIPTGQYLDTYYKVSYNSSPGYYTEILEICDQTNIDFILPSFDADQKLFYPENIDLISRRIVSLSTPEETLKIYQDKDKMHTFLLQNGFNCPKQYSVHDINKDAYYIVKPKNGSGSVGVQRLQGKEILLLQNTADLVIQEVCTGPEYTVECFHLNHDISSVTRERIATKAGVCVKTKIYHDPELELIARKFISTLKAPLYFNLQFMKNSMDEYVITDINLRLAGGMSLSHAAGWDEASAIAGVMQKETTEQIFSHLKLNTTIQYIVRAYTDIITSQKRGVIAIDLDGTLLDSTLRHKIVMDDILRAYDIDIDTGNFLAFKADGKNNIKFLQTYGVEKNIADRIQTHWVELIEDEKYLNADTLYDDAMDFLIKVSEQYELFLLTARKNQTNIEKQIKALGINRFFTKIIVVPNIKDKRQALLDNNATLMIGDTEADYDAARHAGIDFRILNRGFRSTEYWNSKKVLSYQSLLEIIL